MIQIHPNLFVGNTADCELNTPDVAVVHACKDPCHRRAVGYKGNLPSTHPHYLVHQDNNHLYLNMVDMEDEFAAHFTDPIMQQAMAFIERNITERPVLVHCNLGMSRSPSIALLYMARRGFIGNMSYSIARNDFKTIYAPYNPGNGIATYLNRNWEKLLTF
ncbi:dual specificity protein phosphatase [Chitinophaga sp. CF418]|uniref:dual specificity protein phosphatase family protein n=1 Tax=Chitinophaga sp. CF418 TaxID=1855287 RepID=UPI00090F74B2|nr:dual specificity protein phosphatase [Chitinophaga sp. CF418]SHN28931.1 Dual specificity phosphatase, catalytic domain [Chitinophaga sp. CF418]